MSKPGNRVNVVLAEEHTRKLRRLAEQAHLSPGTVARSLLSKALDAVEPSAESITELLNSIDGAYERARDGSADVRAGRFVPVDEL